MLYLVATPIGNRGDLTLRAIEILKSCAYILCEDTRHSLPLLKHFDIHRPVKSFHKFNETSRLESILTDLEQGATVALISDAGTPGISDPGTKIVQYCLERNLKVSPIPGPCAAIAALVASGLPTDRFQFVGFLPRKKGEATKLLLECLNGLGTTICYESPHRLVATLQLLQELEAPRQLVVARELTKKFEEFQRGTAADLLALYKETPPRGEIILLIAGKNPHNSETGSFSLKAEMQKLQSELHLSPQEALKVIAKERGISKRLLYQEWLRDSSGSN